MPIENKRYECEKCRMRYDSFSEAEACERTHDSHTKNMTKKIIKIKGMTCNSCAQLIERKLKHEVNNVSASFSRGEVEVDFDESKISEEKIKDQIRSLGYEIESNTINNENSNVGSNLGFYVLVASIALLLFLVYNLSKTFNISIPAIGENASLFLLFGAGILTGFHCISMCGGFIVSYTAKNALEGHKSFKQHLFYGGAKVFSYAVIGGLFGLVGGIFSFSTSLRGTVAILAGIFMIFYSLGMFGIKFFRKFQINPTFLTKLTSKAPQGPYVGPFVTGLLNGLFIACGPLQAMYLYAAGTGNFFTGAIGLAAFGLGTLPVMLGFGSLTTMISHKTTAKILKISAVIVLILGLIMLNRGLTLTGSSFSLDSIKSSLLGSQSQGNTVGSTISNGVQEINMNVSAGGYSPNLFVLKRGIPVKWNVNVKQLTGCNSELVSNTYNINVQLKTGLNVVEFTPDKEGTFAFSCGMGMLRGSFVVTESGQADQTQVKAATPSAGGTCGAGGSCGGSCGGSGGGCGCGGSA